MEDDVQAVGGFALADARPPGQLLCDVRLSHSALNVPVEGCGPVTPDLIDPGKFLKIGRFSMRKNEEVPVTDKNTRSPRQMK